MRSDILAVDFGTSNSAAAVLENGGPRRLPIEPGSDTLPTAVFFPGEGGAMRIGEAASAALLVGRSGALHAGAEERTRRAVVARDAADRRQAADARGRDRRLPVRGARARRGGNEPARYRRVLSGRPVHFHSRSCPRRPGGRRPRGLLSCGGVRGGGFPRRARGRSTRLPGGRGRRAASGWSSTSAAAPRTSPPSSSRAARSACWRATASGSAAPTSTGRSRWPARCPNSASAASSAARWGRVCCRCRGRSTPTSRPGRRSPFSTRPRRAARWRRWCGWRSIPAGWAAWSGCWSRNSATNSPSRSSKARSRRTPAMPRPASRWPSSSAA